MVRRCRSLSLKWLLHSWEHTHYKQSCRSILVFKNVQRNECSRKQDIEKRVQLLSVMCATDSCCYNEQMRWELRFPAENIHNGRKHKGNGRERVQEEIRKLGFVYVCMCVYMPLFKCQYACGWIDIEEMCSVKECMLCILLCICGNAMFWWRYHSIHRRVAHNIC